MTTMKLTNRELHLLLHAVDEMARRTPPETEVPVGNRYAEELWSLRDRLAENGASYTAPESA